LQIISYLYTAKIKTISTKEIHRNILNFLFYREGFVFFIKEEGKPLKVNRFKVSHINKWETEITHELEINLRLRRNFDKVNAAFVSSFFNLVPDDYLSVNQDDLLNFSEAEFENNAILQDKTNFGNTFIYGISQILVDKLNELYGEVDYFHSGNVFLTSISGSGETKIHLNLYEHNLEVAVTKESEIVFYNLFETLTGEDILFYTLFALEQLNLDPNKAELKTYGQLLPDTKVFQTFKKYIRFVFPALKDEDFLENYTIYKLPECASFQADSEERK